MQILQSLSWIVQYVSFPVSLGTFKIMLTLWPPHQPIVQAQHFKQPSVESDLLSWVDSHMHIWNTDFSAYSCNSIAVICFMRALEWMFSCKMGTDRGSSLTQAVVSYPPNSLLLHMKDQMSHLPPLPATAANEACAFVDNISFYLLMKYQTNLLFFTHCILGSVHVWWRQLKTEIAVLGFEQKQNWRERGQGIMCVFEITCVHTTTRVCMIWDWLSNGI